MFNDGKYSHVDSDYWLFSDETALYKELGDDVVREFVGGRAKRRWEREEGISVDLH